VHFLKNYRFADVSSRQRFEQNYANFQARQKRDIYQSFSYAYVLPGLIERETFQLGEESNCSYLRWFYVCGLAGLLWPFSIWLEQRTSRFKVTV
jgi:hypothetical protein